MVDFIKSVFGTLFGIAMFILFYIVVPVIQLSVAILVVLFVVGLFR